MTYQTIQLTYDAGIATITFNRRRKRNAISFQLLDELLAALDEIERSDALIIILTGAGKAFCAGLDLDELKSLTGKTEAQNVADSTKMAHIFRRLYEFPKPTIAAVNGAAIAGGTGLAPCVTSLWPCRSQVRLHRSAHRICACDRFFDAGLASRTQNRPRSALNRTPVRFCGGPSLWPGQRNCSPGKSDRPGPRTCRTAYGK